ncbi:uncharacterized protein ATC70_000086 [Mucor velutinosus]|uniref:Uncharacterized protein n=1 Tax=Mucor velutinosus TaxID=708070 RepID=A0AAN7HLJ0_9FUNG|nr:hypothetical protein ATC70_000086 [Mucor velutinosus]
MPARRVSGNCEKCHMPYNSARALRTHYANSTFCEPKKARTEDTPLSNSQEQSQASMHSQDDTPTATTSNQGNQSLQQHAAEQRIELPSIESFSYYSSFTLEQKEGLRHVYDLDTLSYATDFNESELLSLKLRDIFDKYPASREMSRESIYFTNTIIKNIAEAGGGIERGIVFPKLIQFDTLEARMRKKTGVQAFIYKVCPQGCKVYPKNDTSVQGVCNHCGTPKSEAQNMKVLSIGDQLARVLSDKSKRDELMSYRRNYQHDPHFYRDYFDGQEYINFQQRRKRHGTNVDEEPILLALYVDGFKPQSNSFAGDTLTLFHVVILSAPPHLRYLDDWTVQTMIAPGKKAPVDLESYLAIFVDEIRDLSEHGMLVRVNGGEVARVSVHLAMATGDLVEVSHLMLHGGVSSQFGCMKCLIDTQGGQCFTRTIRNFQYRTLEQLKAPLPVGVKHVFNIKGPSIFTTLKSFPANPSFYGLDTLHLLSIGLAKHLYELLSSPLHPSKFDNRYKPSIEELKEAKLDKASAWPYTFDLDPKVLAKIGQYVAQSKKTIPTTFNAPFNDIFAPGGVTNYRAVDYEEFMIFIVPALIAPHYPDSIRKPLLGIVKVAALVLQKNELHASDLQFIEAKVNDWHKLLITEIKTKRLPIKTFRPNAHYLGHLTYMIKAQGLPASTSSRSIERSIGRYKRLISARTNVGINAGNIIDRLAIMRAIKASTTGDGTGDGEDKLNDLDARINLLVPRRYDPTTFVNLKNDNGNGSQLWYPVIHTTVSSIPTSINVNTPLFVKAIQSYYDRQYSTNALQNVHINDQLDIVVSGSAWAYNCTYRSEYYRDLTGANSRGSHYIMVWAEHLSNSRRKVKAFYVGAVIFMFKLEIEGIGDELFLLIRLGKTHAVDDKDKTMPIVELDDDQDSSAYLVCTFEQVICQVGLMRFSENDKRYKVITKEKVFRASIETYKPGKNSFVLPQ